MSTSPRSIARVFTGTWLAYAGFYLCRKNFSVLMPLLSRDLHFSKDDLADLVFFYGLAYACGQFVSGTLADRLGAKRVVAAGMVLSAASTFAMAWSSSLLTFAVLQVLNGAAQSAGWPGLLKITASWFDPVRRGVLMAWWTTNYVVGGFIATILTTWCATGPWSAVFEWKGGAAVPAMVLVVVAAIFLTLVSDSRSTASETRRSSAAWRQVLAIPEIRSIAACYFCLKLMRYTFLFWLPLYMVERLSYRAGDAGYMSSVYELVGFAGVPLAGYVSDRLMGGRRFPVGAGMMFALAVACLIFPQLSALNGTANFIAIGLIGILTFGPDTLMSGAATQDAAGADAAATAAGFVNGVGSVGQLLSPFLVAAAVRWTGWDGLFGVFVLVSLAGGIALAAQWGRERRTLEVKLANA